MYAYVYIHTQTYIHTYIYTCACVQIFTVQVHTSRVNTHHAHMHSCPWYPGRSQRDLLRRPEPRRRNKKQARRTCGPDPPLAPRLPPVLPPKRLSEGGRAPDFPPKSPTAGIAGRRRGRRVVPPEFAGNIYIYDIDIYII